jgi:hypothetical protein
MLPFSELIAELFVNISAVSPGFARQFLMSPQYRFLGYEKMTHVRDALGPSHPLPLLLTYNIYRYHDVGEWALCECRDLEFYLDQTEAAAKRWDNETLFFAPFVLVSLLRSAPIPGDGGRHARFVGAVAAALVAAQREALVALLWAVYFFFRQNADTVHLWNALSPPFVQGLAVMLESDDRNVVRLALFANAFLWLIPEHRHVRKTGHKIEKFMKEAFRLRLVVRLAAGDDPEISAYAFTLLTNYMAFDRSTFLAVMRNDAILKVALGVLETGAVRAKTEAVHFVCGFLRKQTAGEWESAPALEVMQALIEALELQDEEVSADILELFIAMAHVVPESIGFLLEREFDTWLLESPQKLPPPFADERLYGLLSSCRRSAGA